MLNNVYVDLTANFSLVFVWYGEEFHNVFWLVIGEDPRTGQPFTFCSGPCSDFRQAARAAWVYLIAADWFVVAPAFEGLPPISDIWRRDFGSSFSGVVKLVEADQGQISGVAYLQYLKTGELKTT